VSVNAIQRVLYPSHSMQTARPMHEDGHTPGVSSLQRGLE